MTMSQSGKILHLYVEVRSVEDGTEQGEGEGLNPLLQGPDVLPQSQHMPPNPVHGSVPPPGVLHKDSSSTQSIASKPTSRHAVSFQLHPVNDTGQLPTRHRQSLPFDGIGQLLSALQPGPNGRPGVLVRTRSSESEPFPGREYQSSGRLTAPPTPSGGRRACGVAGREDEGRRSVVTFSYIEKANIKSVESPRSSVCQSESMENPFNRTMEEDPIPVHLRKRLSDPVRCNSWESPGRSSPKHPCPGLGGTQRDSPNLHRATLDSIAREATYRALEEFGSPQLRRRLAANIPDRGQSDRHHEQPRSQSWAGSPVLPHGARTLPINTHVVDPDRIQDLCTMPRSPATDQLAPHARQAFHTMSPPSNVRSHGVPTHRVPTHGVPTQRLWQGEESPRLAFKHGPTLPSCKPTAIQHEIPAMTVTQPQWNQRTSECPSESPRSIHRVNFNLASTPSKLDEGTNQLSGRKSVSPTNSPEMAHKLAEEASTFPTIFMEWRSPSPTPSGSDAVQSDSPQSVLQSREPQLYASFQSHGSPVQSHSESPIPVQEHHWTDCVDITPSPIRDPQLERVERPGKDSPTLHRHQPPQYMGDSRSPGMERRQYDTHYDCEVRDSLESNRRLYMGLTTETPVSWTCQQQHWREESPTRDRDDSNKENLFLSGASLFNLSKEEAKQRNDLGSQERPNRGSGLRGVRAENGSDREQSGTQGMSQSSSGVTGSLGESTQPEMDCPSPESSSQGSQKSNDTRSAASGIQFDSGSSLMGPSLHSQKIARAKWEFLFGSSTEDHHGTKDTPDASTVPPSGTSSKSPTSTPRFSRPLRPVAHGRPRASGQAGTKSTSHNVQHVEVELVTHAPATVVGALPKTGIIRRTIKYSETDLDAVPLLCYRETDLDEVMLAEQEEVDSAFGSNRSVLGTSGSSPLKGAPYLRTDGEEKELEEEEVVSWTSVRMQGDRQRTRASRQQDEVFSLLLKGPVDSLADSHNPLKSPIVMGGTRRISADNLDSFSRHFESIMESHRAKGTSYSSLDSVDLVTSSGGPPFFTFDLPTLTPQIQSQICESTRQIIELSFAPLARAEPPSLPSLSDPTGSEATLAPTGEGLNSASEDDSRSSDSPCWGKDPRPDAHTDTPFREKPCRQVSEPDSEVAERLALGSTDALANGTKADLQAAKRLAKRLFNLDGFKKSEVSRHLSKNNDFSRMVAEEYLSFFNFSGLTVDQALRAFLRKFALIGETQERERVLSHFSRRYLQGNPNTIPSEDSVHTLTCALMLLNTDLHGHNIGKRMSCIQFIVNLEGLNDGQDFPKELLKALYNSIKNEKLQWTIDEELRKSFSELADCRTDSASHTMKRISSGENPLVTVVQQSSAQVYKNGFLVRKVHADPDGKKTPRGKRGWKSFYGILKGLILYLQKGEYRPDRQLSDEDLKNAVSIHHSLAMRAADYSKRPNVFYLRTADWRVFLFQALNAEQMQSWITRINTVAAMFSAPPFPAAIGSQRKFSRPLLPGSTTKLSQEEQVHSHETRFRAIASELADLRALPPDRKVKGREMEEYKQREEYLEFEKTRYGTYAMLLRAKIRSGEADLSAFEARLFDDGGLQRAHSSPTLPQESSSSHASSTQEASGTNEASGSGRSSKHGKRSEGQRHSYRQAIKH